MAFLASPLYIAIYVINALVVITLVFFERKNPASILLWSLLLLMVPIAGLLLYVLFGKGPSFGRRKKFLSKYTEDEKYKNLINNQMETVGKADFPEEIKELVKFNLYFGALCSTGNEAEIFSDIGRLYKDILTEIENAKDFIHVQFFIIKDDESGKKLINALIKKAYEGLKVRLLYDEIGSFRLSRHYFDELKECGAEVFSFFPSAFKPLNRNINYRNHRKIIVIDGVTAYTGGTNIGDEYIGRDKRLTPWTDCCVKLKGMAASHLNIRFLQDFAFASKIVVKEKAVSLPETGKNVPVQILFDGPDTIEGSIEQSYIKAIYGAKKRVYIQTPYLILDQAFYLALSCAAKSGIDVRVMIPAVADKKIVYYATLSYAADLIKEGVKVYKRKGFLHSKTLLVDEEICSIGSFNIDIRSFFLQFEVTAFMYGKETAEKMLEVFEKDLKECEELGSGYLSKRTLLQRFYERITRLLTPVM